MIHHKNRLLGLWVIVCTALLYCAGNVHDHISFYWINLLKSASLYPAFGGGEGFYGVLSKAVHVIFKLLVFLSALGLIVGNIIFPRLMIYLCWTHIVVYFVFNVICLLTLENTEYSQLDFLFIYKLAIPYVFPILYIIILRNIKRTNPRN